MVSFFKERSVPAVFWAIIVCVALHAFFLVTPPAIVASPDEGLMYYVLQPFAKLPVIILSVIYFIIVIVQAIRINYVLNEARMFQKAPFYPALSYILLTALWPPWGNITAALVANSLLIWLIFRIVKLYNVNQPKALVYNIGLITGSAVLLYYPSIGIIVLVFIALGVTRAFRINEWMVLFLGIITPAYFWCCYLFLTDQLPTLKTLPGLFHSLSMMAPAKTVIIAFGGSALLVIAGIARWQTNRIMLIQARKIWSVLFLMLLLLLPAVFLIKNAWPGALLLSCVPASAFVANTFLYPRRLVSIIFFWLIVVVIVYVNWAAI